MLCYVMLCYVMLCYVILCYVTLYYVMLRFQRNGVFEYFQRWQTRHVKDEGTIQFTVLKRTRGKEMGARTG